MHNNTRGECSAVHTSIEQDPNQIYMLHKNRLHFSIPLCVNDLLYRLLYQCSPTRNSVVIPCFDYLRNMVSKAGMRVWASQKEKTSLGPVINS